MAIDNVLALSIQQPFAEAILAGRKSLEIRSWQTAYRGHLVVHAGQMWYGQREHGKVRSFQDALQLTGHLGLKGPATSYPRGALVGIFELIDCRMLSSEEWEHLRDRHCVDTGWRAGMFGWEIRNPQRLANPIPWRGALGLFPVPESIVVGLPDAR